MTRVRNGAAAEDRLREALETIDELLLAIDKEAIRNPLREIAGLFDEIDREAIRNPLYVKDRVIDGHAVIREAQQAAEQLADARAVIRDTLDFVSTKLNKILVRRDQSAESDLRLRVEALEAWRKQLEASDRAPIPLRQKQG